MEIFTIGKICWDWLGNDGMEMVFNVVSNSGGWMGRLISEEASSFFLLRKTRTNCHTQVDQ